MEQQQQQPSEIPKKMKAVRLVKHIQKFPDSVEGMQEYLQVQDDVDVPVPEHGFVLVRVERVPINPADLSGLKGSYNATDRPNLPTTPGREGSGTVVANGGGLIGWRLVGKRVAAAHSGLWAEYVCVPATACIVLPDEVSWEAGASAWVNPMTVIGFLDVAASGGHKSLVHTAAGSALGKMLIAQAKLEGVDVIGVVRREEQVEELKQLGAAAVFSTSNEKWKEEFKAKCAELNTTLAFDAVAGETTGYVLHNMPKGSVIHVYGGLSEQPCTIPPGDFIFQKKRVEGFWVSEYLRSRSVMRVYYWQRKIASLLNSSLGTSVSEVFPIDEVANAIVNYRGDMGKGKILLNISGTKTNEVKEEEGKGKERESDGGGEPLAPPQVEQHQVEQHQVEQ
eukprot:TRINITY_DN5324_c0_g1_i2.p1 TRINITY_DN5324_c0_g1~~TRINITY_DN5324_c0_g1_i2.p1  ORF type:complete len:394 (-),score=86.76 TRINITY_DN5324_c0_g1_i2:163-1344(-)